MTNRTTGKTGGVAPKPACNTFARHPLMKKGGAHGKTRKAERRAGKQELGREWPVPSA
jgi:hypothetical protein